MLIYFAHVVKTCDREREKLTDRLNLKVCRCAVLTQFLTAVEQATFLPH